MSSSTSSASEYTSSEDEFIITSNYVTKSGRTSRTRYRREHSHSSGNSHNLDNLESSSSSDNKAMASLNLTADQLSNLLKMSNSTDKLPSFRGRAREYDPMFDEKSTFATHITLLRSHIAAIPNLTEYDKKQLLVGSADSKVGDFHLTVSELVNGDYYSNATFNQIVAVLDNIYVTKDSSECNRLQGTYAIRDCLKQRRLTRNWLRRWVKFLRLQPKEVISDVLVFAVVDLQFSDDVHKKVFFWKFSIS